MMWRVVDCLFAFSREFDISLVSGTLRECRDTMMGIYMSIFRHDISELIFAHFCLYTHCGWHEEFRQHKKYQ